MIPLFLVFFLVLFIFSFFPTFLFLSHNAKPISSLLPATNQQKKDSCTYPLHLKLRSYLFLFLLFLLQPPAIHAPSAPTWTSPSTLVGILV